MTQSTPEQRAEAARLLALRAVDGCWYPDYERWGDQLLVLLSALLADAEALAARERADEVRRARVSRPVLQQPNFNQRWHDWRTIVSAGRVRHNRTDEAGNIVIDTNDGVDVLWDGTDETVFYGRSEAMDKLEPEREPLRLLHTLHYDDVGQVVSGEGRHDA